MVSRCELGVIETVLDAVDAVDPDGMLLFLVTGAFVEPVLPTYTQLSLIKCCALHLCRDA